VARKEHEIRGARRGDAGRRRSSSPPPATIALPTGRVIADGAVAAEGRHRVAPHVGRLPSGPHRRVARFR
jgi:hypothetical protein